MIKRILVIAENINQLKAGVVLSYIAITIGTTVYLVYTPFMLRMLGISEYGLFSLVNSAIAYLAILDFGFASAIVRFTAKFRAEKDIEKERSMHGMFFSIYIGIGALSFLLGLVIILNISSLFGKTLTATELVTARVLMWLAVINISITFLFSIFTSILQAYGRFVFAQSLRVLRYVLIPLTMVAILSFGYRSIGMIAGSTAINLLLSIASAIYCIKNLGIRIKFSAFDVSLLKDVSAYSFFIFLGIIVDRLYWSTGQVMLGALSGTAAISIYAIAIQINMYYMELSTAISSVFLPRITGICMNNKDSNELSEFFIKVGRIQFVVMALALSGFVIFGRRFMVLWAGPDYSNSYYVALLIIIPLTVPLIQNIGITILQVKNKVAFRSILYVMIAIMNVFVSMPLIKKYGPLGAALGTAISLFVGHIIIMNIYYHKVIKLNVPKYWVEIGKMAPAVLLAIGIELLILNYYSLKSSMGLVAQIAVFIFLYSIFMWVLGLNSYEKKLFAAPIRKILGSNNKNP